ncbi:MAG: HAMP domain-containing methyl-accepting chemotaxis protein [Cyanobacteria bacterium]|nr:HAMP domain-containing methyl-accepting chemotaxis protein [Cyanobacteriota bacterium]
MRRSMTIKARQYMTLGFVAVLLAAAAGLAAWQLRSVSGQVAAVDASAQSAAKIAALGGQVGSLLAYERSYFLDLARQHPVDAALERWNTARLAVVTTLDAIEKATAGSAVTATRATLTKYEREFASLRDRVALEGLAAADPEGPAGEATRTAFTQLTARVDTLTADVGTQLSAGTAAAGAGISRGYWMIALGVVSAIMIAAIGFTLMTFGRVAADTAALVSVCDSVSTGDLDARVADLGDSELGRVGRALNSMLDRTARLADSQHERDQMQAALMKLLSEVSGVAEGDLTVQAEVTSDVTGAVADSFNLMIVQLRQIIGQVQAASRQISMAVGELRDVTENLASGSDDQAAQAVEASVAIEEMAASIHYVSENASSSATVAEQARANAEHGTRAVTRTIEGMKAVRDQVQETAKRIKRLGESSQEIGEIVELIGDIGDRTSILALNASIQAAMAGEAGRGFAIVADEVERLADRATEATKRASMLVKATQSETAEVMTAMEDTTREVINRSNIANEAGVALAEIQGVSNRLAELLQAISDAAQQQARGSEQVAKSMNEMSAVTRNTASGTKQTAAAIHSLGVLVDNLNGIVTRFKLPAAADAETPAFAQPRLVASR